MKKLMMILFASALVMSCGNGEAEKKAAEEEAAQLEMINNEIHVEDSISEVLEQAKAEIEATSEELNSLLEEL